MPYSPGTGEPKGCMVTHRSTMPTLVASMRWFEVPTELTLLAVAPFFHVTGMQGMHERSIYNGNTVVLLSTAMIWRELRWRGAADPTRIT